MMNTRKQISVLAIIGAATLGACDDTTSSSGGTSTTPPPSATSPDTGKPAAADNTGRNKRDEGGVTKTPMDQSNDKADIEISASIRRAIMDNKSMSTNAQNVKIITEKGVVTLRGVVNSQGEKDAIESVAKSTAGVTRVANELEIKVP